MASIKDERGYNQGFRKTKALELRTQRRADVIISNMMLPTEIDLRKKIRILEIGCGTGELSYLIANITNCIVTGVDLSEDFIKFANENYKLNNLNFLCNDLINENNLNDYKYDFIIGNGILHHLYYHLNPFLLCTKDMLNINGKILFWEPNLYNPYIYSIFNIVFLRRFFKLEPTEMAFTSNYISRLLVNNGYKVNVIQEKDFLLPCTPFYLINLNIYIGELLEKYSITRIFAQSIFIVESK